MLPLEIIRLKAKGCDVKLYANTPGFTLPSNIGELGDDIVNLDLSGSSLRGITRSVFKPRYATEANRRFLTRSPFPRCAGAIPESIGNLTNLRTLFLQGNKLSGA